MRAIGWLAAGLAAVAWAGWWFVLRVGPRREPNNIAAPTSAAAAAGLARDVLAAGRPRHADVAHAWAPSSAASVEVLPEGRVFFPRMLADIAAATHSVHIMQYGFQPGTIGDQFAPLLAEKATSGVGVRIIIDSVGSAAYSKSRAMLESLAAAGAEVMLHDAMPPDRSGPLGRRRMTWRAEQAGRVEHRKLVLVDGTTAYIGGAGIEDHFANGLFHDVYVRVTGPVVRQLQAMFLTSFAYHGGTMPIDDDLDAYFPDIGSDGPHPVTLLMNWPRGWLPLTDAAAALVAGATRRIDLMNPYIGDRQMIEALVAAAARGVKVRLVVSDEAHGNGVAYSAFKHHYDALLEVGAEIWEYPALVHAKVIVADDRTLVGTLNLDAWAMFRNPELGLLFDDSAVAEQFRTVLFEPDIAASTVGQPASGTVARTRNRLLSKADYLL